MQKKSKHKLVLNHMSIRELSKQQLYELDVVGAAPCTCRGSGCGSNSGSTSGDDSIWTLLC